MTNWVFGKDPTFRARAHKAICTRCNNGQRKKGLRLPGNRKNHILEPNSKRSTTLGELASWMPKDAGSVAGLREVLGWVGLMVSIME